MKKILTIALSVLAFAAVASAQPRAIGVRVGGSAEASYQHSLGNNFLEADLGLNILNGNGFYLTGVYDFVFASTSGFNFYAGPGAQLGFYNRKNDEGNNEGHFSLAIAGQLGAEYEFNAIPFNISLDWRPCWDFLGNGFGWSSFALGFRYRF